jgi:hypothetical protein
VRRPHRPLTEPAPANSSTREPLGSNCVVGCLASRTPSGPSRDRARPADTRRVVRAFYLVFKEPAASPDAAPRSSGEPSNCMIPGPACQPLFSPPANFFVVGQRLADPSVTPSVPAWDDGASWARRTTAASRAPAGAGTLEDPARRGPILIRGPALAVNPATTTPRVTNTPSPHRALRVPSRPSAPVESLSTSLARSLRLSPPCLTARPAGLGECRPGTPPG